MAALAEALNGGLAEPFARAVELLSAITRPRDRHRRRQKRPYRHQDRRDARLDRHAGLLRPSVGGQSRRSRHDRARRRHHRHVVVWRELRAQGHRLLCPPLRHSADRGHGRRRLRAGARSRYRALACRKRRKPARTDWRRRPRRSCSLRSAMRSRSRCSKRAASPPTISAPSIQAASSAPTSPKSARSCISGDEMPVVPLGTKMPEAVTTLARKRFGCVVRRQVGRPAGRHRHRRRPRPQPATATCRRSRSRTS